MMTTLVVILRRAMRPVSIMRIDQVEKHGKSSRQSSLSKVAPESGHRAENGRGIVPGHRLLHGGCYTLVLG